MELSRKKLNREVNIIELIKQSRYFKKALKSLIAENVILKFKERSRFLAIDPEQDSKNEVVSSKKI